MSDSNHLSVLPKKPLLEGRNFFVQLIFLVLFVLLGTIVFSSAGLLVSYLIWGANVAEHPTADYYRLLQAFNAVGTFLIPALLFSYAHYHRWFTYSQADCAVNDARKYLYVSLLSIFLIPVVGLVATLNGMIHLPDPPSFSAQSTCNSAAFSLDCSWAHTWATSSYGAGLCGCPSLRICCTILYRLCFLTLSHILICPSARTRLCRSSCRLP